MWKHTSLLTLIGWIGIGYWWKAEEVSITGNVRTSVVLMEHDVILSCQVGGCSSSNLDVWLYKWGHSKKDALYIHSNSKQDKVWESSTGERHENGRHKGQFKNGVLEVTLSHVQTEDSGQYVCAITCGHVYKEVTMDLIVTGIINASVGENAILLCDLRETHKLSYWKLQWRRISPGKNEAIYSYFYNHQYQDTCPVLYSKDSLYKKCSYLSRPIIRKQIGKKYKEKAEFSIRNCKGFLKLNNVKEDDAGRYQCLVRSNSIKKRIIFKLSTEEIHDQNIEIFFLNYVFAFFMLLMICIAGHNEWRCSRKELQKHEIQIEEQNHYAEECQKLKRQIEYFEARFYRVDVTLDPSTAHPRLEVSEDGKHVRDSGNVLQVPNNKERFDSHMFVLAKKGFSKGKNYWEVEVGQKTSWDLGVASESIFRKGKITLAPKNGYWVLGLDGKKDYWARTDPWTHLEVSGKLTKIGMFLNMQEKSLTFYDVNRRSKLHTYALSSSEKFYPFFSIGSVTEKLNSHPLKIPPWFKEDVIDNLKKQPKS